MVYEKERYEVLTGHQVLRNFLSPVRLGLRIYVVQQQLYLFLSHHQAEYKVT
jgi:hypothetical protein